MPSLLVQPFKDIMDADEKARKAAATIDSQVSLAAKKAP